MVLNNFGVTLIKGPIKLIILLKTGPTLKSSIKILVKPNEGGYNLCFNMVEIQVLITHIVMLQIQYELVMDGLV